MFTGIVEELGAIERVTRGTEGLSMRVRAATVLENTALGDSIMVNGACLTVTAMGGGAFDADISAETARVTTLGSLAVGSRVHLERAMAMGGRLGGHMVSGHVDGVGTIRSTRKVGKAVELWFDAPASVVGLSVEKGSIAVEGVSLTINGLDDRGFSVMIIPHTGSHTTLLTRAAGGRVNLEADLIGKYVARLLKGYGAGGQAGRPPQGGLSAESLMKL